MESKRDYTDMLEEEKCDCSKHENQVCDICQGFNKEECCDKEPCCEEEAPCCDEEAPCCDEEEVDIKQYWKNKEKRDNKAKLHIFKDQTKEEAEIALKRAAEERRVHPDACDCRFCEFKTRFMAAQPSKPEIYASHNQTVEEVKKLLEESTKSQKIFKNIENPPGVGIEDFLAEDSDFTKSIRDSFEKCDEAFDHSPKRKDIRSCDYVMANWRKLAGVKRGEVIAKEENKDLADELMNCILKKVQGKFRDLKIKWSDDWLRHLTINDALTNIHLAQIAKLHENLLHFVSKEESMDIIGDIMLKKLSGLFI